MKAPRQWRTKARTPIFEHPVINLAQLEVRPEPAQHADEKRSVVMIESNDWVNIVAINERADEPELLLIKQWRFGCEAHTLEIPGGLVDDGEAPEAAARRELLEETGYACRTIERLGVVQPNPALFNNRCHLYLARNLEHRSDPVGDGDEEIEVFTRPVSDLARSLEAGEIQHALVITALHFFSLWQARNPGVIGNA